MNLPYSVELKGVTFGYAPQKTIVSNIDLAISPGEVTGLMGESGSGKTTIGRLITGQIAPVSGSILLNGERVGILRERNFAQAAMIQYVFQNIYAAIEPELTVEQVLMEPTKLCRKHAYLNILAADKALESVGLRPYSDWAPRKVGQLSGGQRQRLAIARALVPHPSLIIIDESTSMLDKPAESVIVSYLQSIASAWGTSVLVISHDLGLVSKACGKLYILYQGKLIDGGETKQVLENPRSKYTKDLVDGMRFFEGDECIG